MNHDPKAVLIVEDDRDARESLAALLETEGHEVLQAEHGERALQLLKDRDVCLILLDLFMPVMNGWAFLGEQSRDPAVAGIPVVVITADPAAARAASEQRVAAALTKPLNHRRLLELVALHC